MASRFDSLIDDGFRAYDANRFREAALLWSQAREHARALGEQASAFKAGVWEAEAWRVAGESRRALGLLLSLLADVPEDAPTYERWIAEKKTYDIWLALSPRAASARAARLERLAAYTAEHPGTPPADLPHLQSKLALDRGHFDEALRFAEQAWTVFDGRGYFKCDLTYFGILALLELGRPIDAARWRALLAETEQEYAHGRDRLHIADAQIALHTRAPPEALGPILQSLEEDLVGTDPCDNATTRHVAARLHLLRQSSRDPEDPLHPVRAALRVRPEEGRDFDRLLVIADLRLASLRHALGVPACDDLYYQRPQQLASPLPPAPPLRLRRLRAALSALAAEAQTLDDLLETDWYSRRARAREQRAAELIAATRTP